MLTKRIRQSLFIKMPNTKTPAHGSKFDYGFKLTFKNSIIELDFSTKIITQELINEAYASISDITKDEKHPILIDISKSLGASDETCYYWRIEHQKRATPALAFILASKTNWLFYDFWLLSTQSSKIPTYAFSLPEKEKARMWLYKFA